MLISLKKLHNSILQERYAVLQPGYAYQDKSKARDTLHNPKLTPESLKKIYELEYKLYQMSLYKRRKGEWLHDSANMTYLKWKTELEQLLSQSIKSLYDTIMSWSIVEEHVYIIDEKYPGGRHQWEDDLISDMYAEHPDIPRGSDEWDEAIAELDWRKREDYIEEVWEGTAEISSGRQNPYPLVQKALDSLKSATGSIQDRIVVFHKGLTTTHNNGSMLEYAIKGGDEYSNKKILDDLTNGVYIPKWEEELQRLGFMDKPEKEGLQLLEATAKHPSPEEIAKTLL